MSDLENKISLHLNSKSHKQYFTNYTIIFLDINYQRISRQIMVVII